MLFYRSTAPTHGAVDDQLHLFKRPDEGGARLHTGRLLYRLPCQSHQRSNGRVADQGAPWQRYRGAEREQEGCSHGAQKLSGAADQRDALGHCDEVCMKRMPSPKIPTGRTIRWDGLMLKEATTAQTVNDGPAKLVRAKVRYSAAPHCGAATPCAWFG